MAFIYGVEKVSATGFPLKISMRLETRDIMVFDDPLAITRAHVLSVPTNVYCLTLILSHFAFVLKSGPDIFKYCKFLLRNLAQDAAPTTLDGKGVKSK